MEISITDDDLVKALGIAVLNQTKGMDKDILKVVSTPEAKKKMMDAVTTVIAKEIEALINKIVDEQEEEGDVADIGEQPEQKNITEFPKFGKDQSN